MSLVSQDVVLFNTSIAANIAYAESGEVRPEDIAEAAASANLEEFIASLPAGLETRIGDRGDSGFVRFEHGGVHRRHLWIDRTIA